MTSEVRSDWVNQTPDLSPLSASSNLGLGGKALPVSHPRLENRKYGRDDRCSVESLGTNKVLRGTAFRKCLAPSERSAEGSVFNVLDVVDVSSSARTLGRGSHMLFLGLRGLRMG